MFLENKTCAFSELKISEKKLAHFLFFQIIKAEDIPIQSIQKMKPSHIFLNIFLFNVFRK